MDAVACQREGVRRDRLVVADRRCLVGELDGPRRELVETLRNKGIRDERVLEAIGRVRREAFVPPRLAEHAYDNTALPIGHHQTISQPLIVALMTEALGLHGSERVLEVGTGSGYQAAILAELAGRVVSIERVPELLAAADAILSRLGYRNLELHVADGSLGWPAGAPYDRIIVTAAGPEVPSSLLRQLAVGGRLVIPVGQRSDQNLVVIERTDDGFVETSLGPVRFVPLVGAGGWPDAPSDEELTPSVDPLGEGPA